MIKDEAHARFHAAKYLQCLTLVVGENGDIHANCDVEEVCSAHENAGEKFYILKGERKKKKADKVA